MDNIIQSIKEFLIELLFPSFCLGCKKEGVLFCDDCKSTLEISDYNYCLCNKNPLRLVSFAQGKLQGKCQRCQDKNLSGLYSALPYKEKFLTKKLIYQFKYEPYLKILSKNLAGILIEHLVLAKNNTEQIWKNSVLVPVPMEKKKQKDRGYNQAEELAKELSKTLEVPVMTGILIKTIPTAPQMKLSKEGREKNVKDAFSVNPVRNTGQSKLYGFLKKIMLKKYLNKLSSEIYKEISEDGISNGVKNQQIIQGKRIFLVDDVYTTGSTMEECARVLKNAGVKQVWGIAVAREG